MKKQKQKKKQKPLKKFDVTLYFHQTNTAHTTILANSEEEARKYAEEMESEDVEWEGIGGDMVVSDINEIK